MVAAAHPAPPVGLRPCRVLVAARPVRADGAVVLGECVAAECASDKVRARAADASRRGEGALAVELLLEAESLLDVARACRAYLTAP